MSKGRKPEDSLTEQEKSTWRTYEEQAGKIVGFWLGGDRKDSYAPSKEMSEFCNLLPENGRVLDIGAGGSGHVARWLIENGFDYTGIDISSAMLEQIHKNNPGIEIKLERINIYDLDFDEPFDGFRCSAVLLHIPKNRIDEALSAIHRNMKQGAVGMISIKEGDREVMEKDGRFHSYWLDEDFSERLNSNGYKILKRSSDFSRGINWLKYLVRTDNSKNSS